MRQISEKERIRANLFLTNAYILEAAADHFQKVGDEINGVVKKHREDAKEAREIAKKILLTGDDS